MATNLQRICALTLKNYRSELTNEELDEFTHLLREAGYYHLLEYFLNKKNIASDLEYHARAEAEQIWQKISDRIGSLQPADNVSVPRQWRLGWYVAAAAIVIIALELITLFIVKKDPSPDHLVELIDKKDIPPGGTKAVLTLSQGDSINLEYARNGLVAKQGNFEIHKTDGGILYKKTGSSLPHSAIVFNQLKVPASGEFDVVLPDGSKLRLNANSTLTVPVSSFPDERKVELSGEAYFDIVHNNTPFNVHVGAAKIRVLGTVFEVKAYSDNSGLSATLIRGKISIDNINAPDGSPSARILAPGQQAIMNEKGEITINSRADTSQAVAWTKGIFKFSSAEVKEIMDELSRWYNVQIQYKGDVEKLKLTVDISRNVSIDSAISKLNRSLTVERIGNKLIVSPKQ